MPHVGIVVDVTAWSDGLFVAVEGQVDGCVKKVTRHRFDVLGFGRPDFERPGWDVNVQTGRWFSRWRPGRKVNVQTGNKIYGRPAREDKTVQTDRPVSVYRVQPGRRGRDVMNVQLALVRAAGLDHYAPGVFDESTRRAFARWQRILGHVGPDADGVPTLATLERLGDHTGVFTIER